MASIRDADLSLWLHNKLGQLDDHWSAKIISPHLNPQTITNAATILNNFQPQVKIKFLLSLLHVSRRNIEEWKNEIDQFIEVASECSDQWCSALAKLLKSYPEKGIINFDNDVMDEYFPNLLEEIQKIIDSNPVNHNVTPSLLPLESLYLNKNALQSITGYQPTYTKYFALKRKPKSAILRAEMLQKASDAHIQAKSKNPMGALIPIKSKVANKSEASQFLDLKFKSQTTNSSSKVTKQTLSTTKKEGGKIKLLDISEQPLTTKDAKKRRKLDDISFNFNLQTNNPGGSHNPAPFFDVHTLNPNHVAALSNFSNAGNVQMKQNSQVPDNLAAASYKSYSNIIVNNPNVAQAPDNINSPSNINTSNNIDSEDFNTNLLSDADKSVPITINNPNLLKLTSEQIAHAQEIFKDANKVSAPEKALILAFMSGIRDNPCPNQGHVLSIKLSERLEEVNLSHQTSSDAALNIANSLITRSIMVAQIFFQMNYATGEWKRVKTYRNFIENPLIGNDESHHELTNN